MRKIMLACAGAIALVASIVPRFATHNAAPATAIVRDEDTLEAAGPQPLDLHVVQYVGGAVLGQAKHPASAAPTSLAAIYQPVNIKITILASTPAANPFGSSRPTKEELQRLAAVSGGAASGAWRVTMFLLRLGPQEGDLGLMFADDSRDRFAVFAAELHNDPSRILRTSAHELGHALNLFHNDSDGNFDCCAGDGTPKSGLTVMNSDVCLSQQWGFDFSPAEREHLLRHPIGNIRPNSGKRFGECIAGHRKTC